MKDKIRSWLLGCLSYLSNDAVALRAKIALAKVDTRFTCMESRA